MLSAPGLSAGRGCDTSRRYTSAVRACEMQPVGATRGDVQQQGWLRAASRQLLRGFTAMRASAGMDVEQPHQQGPGRPLYQTQQQQQSGSAAGPEHLVVLVNGLFGGPSNWTVVVEQLQARLDKRTTLLHVSQANSRFATYDGIDVCGQRLADEVRSVVAEHGGLRRISFVAHSMGGLMARYAAGVLFNPTSRSVAGLAPAHFVTLATPHMGCDAGGCEAQVPFISWCGDLPLLGQPLCRLLQVISAPTAALLFKRTGAQFFLSDGVDSPAAAEREAAAGAGALGLPLLVQMTQDVEEKGLYFYSALAAFRTRTAYANTEADHLVGWANASLRSLSGLPQLPEGAVRATGVVRDDPVEAAWFPNEWRQLQRSNGGGGSARMAASADADSSAHCWHTLASGGDENLRDERAATAVVDSCGTAELGTAAGVVPGAAAAGMALQHGLAEGRDTTPALSRLAAVLDVSAQVVAESDAQQQHPECEDPDGADCFAQESVMEPLSLQRVRHVERMLHRLQELPWRRIDVCFKGAGIGLAHNNIQVTRRWLNFEGVAVTKHLAEQFAAMEGVLQSRLAGHEASATWPADAMTAAAAATDEI